MKEEEKGKGRKREKMVVEREEARPLSSSPHLPFRLRPYFSFSHFFFLHPRQPLVFFTFESPFDVSESIADGLKLVDEFDEVAGLDKDGICLRLTKGGNIGYVCIEIGKVR